MASRYRPIQFHFTEWQALLASFHVIDSVVRFVVIFVENKYEDDDNQIVSNLVSFSNVKEFTNTTIPIRSADA